MEERFFFVAYASSASTDFSPEELTDLLAVSRARNAAAGVTGLLVYKGGNFLQALEGPEDAVRATMQRISAISGIARSSSSTRATMTSDSPASGQWDSTKLLGWIRTWLQE